MVTAAGLVEGVGLRVWGKEGKVKKSDSGEHLLFVL